MRSLPVVLLLGGPLAGASVCEPPPGPDAGPAVDGGTEVPVVIIGDPQADAEIHLVFRNADGSGFTDFADGAQVPLILPPQGGKVTLIGVRAKNVTSRLQVNAGLSDDCVDPPRIIGREGRPILLVEGADGFGVPDQPDTLQNYANIPVCPSFASTRDGDGQPYRLELRLTEQHRVPGDTARTHVVTATVTPECAEPLILAECRCECDADFITGTPRDQQCPTINDNDTDAGVCP